jgi:hypothetical protein
MLLGSRWPDLKGMPSIVANNFAFESYTDIPDGQAGQSPYAHFYQTDGYVRKYTDDPDVLSDSLHFLEKEENNAGGRVERLQYTATATASFLVDRFLQAESTIAPQDAYTVANFYKMEQELEYFWWVPCQALFAEATIAGEVGCPQLLNDELVAACELALHACLVDWEAAVAIGWADGDFNGAGGAYPTMSSATGLCDIVGAFSVGELTLVPTYANQCLGYMALDTSDDGDREGERFKAQQTQFMIGQGIRNCLADSNAARFWG